MESKFFQTKHYIVMVTGAHHKLLLVLLPSTSCSFGCTSCSFEVRYDHVTGVGQSNGNRGDACPGVKVEIKQMISELQLSKVKEKQRKGRGCHRNLNRKT